MHTEITPPSTKFQYPKPLLPINCTTISTYLSCKLTTYIRKWLERTSPSAPNNIVDSITGNTRVLATTDHIENV